MKMLQNKYLILLLVLLFPFICFADVTLSDEAYTKIINRLKKDKVIIEEEQLRWAKLKTAQPKINYTVAENKIIIQTIEIPVYKSKPLTYEIQFEVTAPEQESSLIPLNIFLAGIIEIQGIDAKLGVQFLNIEKVSTYPIGLNIMVGVKSFGGSISYSLKKPFDNTMLHVYIGKTYDLQSSYGVGLSLNF